MILHDAQAWERHYESAALTAEPLSCEPLLCNRVTWNLERSKSVVVLRSKQFTSDTNGSSPLRCNCLRNIVASEVFRTSQQSGQVCKTVVGAKTSTGGSNPPLSASSFEINYLAKHV